jgi:hypothetical protein
MSWTERKVAIEAVEALRSGRKLISYVTSTRQGFESQMAMDAIEPVYRNLVALRDATDDISGIDLFIHSNGGDGIVPWRLVTLIREFSDDFCVMVPNRAFSAATLTALGADRVIMHPMGMLGPTDPTVTNPFNPPDPNNQGQVLGISVEDVASYFALVKEDVGIRHEDELIQAFNMLAERVHPLALGSVKRSTQQSRMMGEKLLRRRNHDPLTDHAIEDIVRKLASELYFHGHPINRREAREDVGLDFVEDASDELAEAMWALYEGYAKDMQLGVAFNPMIEATRIQPAQLPPLGQATQQQVTLPKATGAIVESSLRSDTFATELEVTMIRDHMGNVNGAANVVSQGWSTETP